MPVVTVNLWEEALDPEVESELIGAVTQALADVLGEHVRPHTTVLLAPVPQRRWGTAGVASSAGAADG